MEGKRVLLFPLPLQGHINPMLQLANILHSKGFSITIIHTNFNNSSNIQTNYPHFTFHSISDGLSEDDEKSKTDAFFLLSLLNDKCVPHFKEALEKLLLEDPNNNIVCLISDAILHFTRDVAHSLKLPSLVLRTGGICSFLTCAAFPLLLHKGYFPLQEFRLDEAVEELPPLRMKDLPLFKTCNIDAVYEVVRGMVRETKASSGLILNSFEELEHPSMCKFREDFPIPIFPIGPFHSHFPASSSSLMLQDHTSISWLDIKAPNSVIYVSFGSIATIEVNEFVEIAWGLVKSNQPFLWVVRRGSEWVESILPNELLEKTLDGRGHIVKWAPQQEVLAHPAVGAFLTHNGWNSIVESICEGVPMICMPCFGDQMVNARYVSHVWKVGVQLENGSERTNIEKAIRTLMADEEEGNQIKERMLELKEKANSCLKPGGSSYESLSSLTSYISSL